MGYLMAREYDSIDISKRMVYHRGTVQHGIAHTIKTEIDVGVLEFDGTSSNHRWDAETPKQKE